jgi:hypothetical protein
LSQRAGGRHSQTSRLAPIIQRGNKGRQAGSFTDPSQCYCRRITVRVRRLPEGPQQTGRCTMIALFTQRLDSDSPGVVVGKHVQQRNHDSRVSVFAEMKHGNKADTGVAVRELGDEGQYYSRIGATLEPQHRSESRFDNRIAQLNQQKVDGRRSDLRNGGACHTSDGRICATFQRSFADIQPRFVSNEPDHETGGGTCALSHIAEPLRRVRTRSCLW